MNEDAKFGVGRVTRFYVPLLLQAFSQSLAYPLVAGIVTHGEYGVDALTAFSQGLMIMFMVGALGGGLVTTGLVFAKTWVGYVAFRRLNALMMGALLVLQCIPALPPFSGWIFSGLFALPPELASVASRTLLAGVVMNAFFFLRNVPMVVLFNNLQSGKANNATLVRIAVTLALAVAFPRVGLVGPWWGCFALTFGVGVELAVTWLYARPYVARLPNRPAGDGVRDVPSIPRLTLEQFRFTLPLSLGGFLLMRRNRFDKPVRWAITIASAIWFVVALVLLLRGLFGGTGDQQVQPNITIPPVSVEQTQAPAEDNGGGEDIAVIDLGGGAIQDDTSDEGEDTSSDADTGTAPSPTPLSDSSNGASADNASYVWSPASGLYYHATEDCPRIESGVQVWRVTREIAENSRHQSPCPDCIGGGTAQTYYGTLGGKYYHTDSTCSNMKNPLVYTKQAAENEGKTPCPVCILKTQSKLEQSENVSTAIISSSTADKSGIQVYATKNGTYFHVKSDCSGMQNATRGPLKEALLAGKTACPVCCEQAGTLVYCTSGGKSYHVDKNCQGMTGARQVTLAEAMVLGKSKCNVCIKGSLVGVTQPGATVAPTDGSAAASSGSVSLTGATGDDVKVYATQNGTYYHTNSTCSGMKNAQLYTLKSMLAAGKKACPVCASSANTQVYATKGGKYYHSYATCSGMSGASSGTLAEALAAGYRRCPECWGNNAASAAQSASAATATAAGTKSSTTAAKAKTANTTNATNTGSASPGTTTKAQAAASKATAGNTYVYATRSGSYYHLNSGCGGMTGASRITLKTAVNAGKKPCPICASAAKRTVYSTSNGSHYHVASVCAPSGMKNGKKRTLAEALLMNQTACPYCLGSRKAAEAAVEAAKAATTASTSEAAAQAAASLATRQSSAVYKSGKSGVRVYATVSGKYYHTRSNCSNISGTPSRVTLETALNYGKKACPVCASTATRKVYATRGGKYYHYSKADAGSGAKQGTLAAALAYGLDPCPNCVTKTAAARTADSSGTYQTGTSGIKVYATRGSKYYHSVANCSGLTGASRISLETALNYGKKACPVCLGTASIKVYAVPGEKTYHFSKAHAGSGAIAGTLAKAKASGMKACSLCAKLSAGASSPENGGAENAPVSIQIYPASADTKVYIELGSANTYYHAGSKCSKTGFKDGTAVSLEYAIEWEFKACPYCTPPTSILPDSSGA